MNPQGFLLSSAHFACEIGRLTESRLNFRQTYDADRLKQLAQSIATTGMTEPILARPVDPTGAAILGLSAEALAMLPSETQFEIASGHRRRRAAEMAGLELVPVIVRSMTNDELVEAISHGILEHEGIHELEEAQAFRNLNDPPLNYSYADIGARINRDADYVKRRLALLRLSAPLQKAFRRGVISLAVAKMLAPLREETQQEGLRRWVIEDLASPERLKSSREVQKWIAEEVMLSLKAAPFDPDDAALLPLIGSCLDCPKRSGYEQTLFQQFPDGDLCTDRECYGNKRDKTLLITIDTLKAEGSEPLLISTSPEGRKAAPHFGMPVLGSDAYKVIAAKGKKPQCDSQRSGLVVRGIGQIGAVLTICPNSRCAVHGKPRVSSAAAGQTEPAAGAAYQETESDSQAGDGFVARHSIGADAVNAIAKEVQRQAAKREAQLREAELTARTRKELIAGTVKRFDPKKPKLTDLRLLASHAFWKLGNVAARRAVSKRWTGVECDGLANPVISKWLERATADKLMLVLYEMALFDCLAEDIFAGEDEAQWHDRDLLSQCAAGWGLKPEAVRASVAKEMAAELAKSEPAPKEAAAEPGLFDPVKAEKSAKKHTPKAGKKSAGPVKAASAKSAKKSAKKPVSKKAVAPKTKGKQVSSDASNVPDV